MEKTKKNPGLGRIALLSATLLWGTSFVIMKNTLDSIHVLHLLSIRFLLAGMVMFLLGFPEWKRLDRGTVRGGIWMGLALAASYLAQTYGLMYTTPGKNAFLTAVYCVLTPFLYWIYKHRRPDKFNVIAALLSMLGVGLISLDAGLSIGLGDALTLLGGLCYGIHIIIIDENAGGRSAIMLNAIQFLTAAAITIALSLLIVPAFSMNTLSLPTMGSILYLALGCTAATFLLQTFGQKHTPPSQAAVLMTLESVIGVIVSVIFYHEKLTLRLTAGFLVMFVAVLISETKLSFIKKKNEEEKTSS